MIKNVAPEQNKNYTVDIVEALQSGVIIIDDETLRILYINPAGASIIGRERSDILGKVCYNFICPPSDKPCHIRGMNECCQFSEKLLLTASGKTIPVLKNAIRIIYEERNCILESFFSLAEHRGIEARLRLNEHSLNEIQRIAHIGSFIYNLKTGTWKSTPILDEILGIDENFDRTSAGWDYLLDSDWKKVLTAYFKTELNQNHKQFEMEFPIIRKSDGKIRWVNGVGKLEADNEKKFIRMLGSIQDITEHRNVREEIVKLAKFPEENPNPVLRVSENGNLLYANDASKLFRGRLKSTTTENGSQHWKTDIFDIKKTGERKLSKKWMENVTKALESGKVIHDELQYHDQYFSMSYAPVPEAGYVNIYSFDITDQKRDEQYLIVQQHVSQILTEEETFPNANQRILKSIINSLQWEWGETWWLDADLDILTLSAYWFNPDLDLYEFETESLQTTFEYGIGLPGQIWKNKSPIWIGDVAKDPTFCRSEIASKSDLHGAFAFPIQFDNDFIGVLVFFSKKVLSYDNSLLKLMGNIGNQLGQFIKRRDAEKKLVKAKNIAETANKSKSIFLANMSHELRTPLNAILGFCQLMEREESLPERSKEYLGIIGQSGEHLLNMINSVLELSKIEAGKNTLQIFSFDMIQTLENLEKMLALRAKWKGLTLCIRINPSTP
ncbi:PAS domain S-box protein, partial [bacterium]|nr:PAS domain S-box protein [bacterium]